MIALTKLYHPCRSLINTCVKQTTLLVFRFLEVDMRFEKRVFDCTYMVWKCPFLNYFKERSCWLLSEWLTLTHQCFLKAKKVLNSIWNLKALASGFTDKFLKILMLFLRATNLNLWWCKLWIIVVSILLQKQFVLRPFLACERQRSTYCSNISSFHCCILSQTTPNNQSECRKPFSSFEQSLWLNVSQVSMNLIPY